MRPFHAALGLAAAVGLVMGVQTTVKADETDAFTCRARPLRESSEVVDELVNAAIGRALDKASRRAACDEACLFDTFRDEVGATHRQRFTGIPHARIAREVTDHGDIDRCHLAFRESIYGARPYNQPWLYPVNGRVIFLADSIRLAGRVVGIDKINHFLRQGLGHWRTVDRDSSDLASAMRKELGGPGRELTMSEHGLKGLGLTGVVAYSDLAAGYSGYLFWRSLLSVGQPDSYVAYDYGAGRFVQARPFTFAAYVTDAWDEGINCSVFDATVGRQVADALRARQMTCPVTDCAALADLPEARLYVNPTCFGPRPSIRPGEQP